VYLPYIYLFMVYFYEYIYTQITCLYVVTCVCCTYITSTASSWSVHAANIAELNTVHVIRMFYTPAVCKVYNIVNNTNFFYSAEILRFYINDKRRHSDKNQRIMNTEEKIFLPQCACLILSFSVTQ